MATTKKTADRPKISSSHASRPAPSGGKRPAKKGAATTRTARTGAASRAEGTASRAPARATKTTAKPKSKRPAEKPSRVAVRSAAIAAGTQRPKKATVEVRDSAAEASKALALEISKAALDKKAVNVQIVDVVGRVDYADFLVLMSGRSDRHVLAVADGIEDHLLGQTPKRKPVAVEGRPQGKWVVLDFGEVVAHVFQEEARDFYDLDSLWQDARRVPVADPARASVAGAPSA